jgi:hypothetical protein
MCIPSQRTRIVTPPPPPDMADVLGDVPDGPQVDPKHSLTASRVRSTKLGGQKKGGYLRGAGLSALKLGSK